MRTATVFLLLALIGTSALAGPPINGTYQTTDLGGTMLAGRFSESWSIMWGSRLQPGNTTNQQSWDGVQLGTQWQLSCASISGPPLVLLDTVDGNGNGQRQYLVSYQGGVVVLDGNGPWGDGSEASYNAVVDLYSEVQLFTFENNKIVGVVSSTNMMATFVGFNNTCMTLSISNHEEHGSINRSLKPPNYPGFLEPGTCAPGRAAGRWGEADEFTLVISGCALPTEHATWGAIKALYE